GRHALRQDAYAEYSTTRRFELLSAEHPGYRLAAEYRLGWYLLSHQLDPLVAALPSLPGFGRDHLPRHLEEAVLCWEALHGQPAELGPWRVRTATRERFDAFVRALGCDRDELRIVLRTPGRPPVSALKLLGGPWSDTYYGYRLFGTSGGGR
ncbi:MAG: hypothetical protein HYU66_02150, partial [Armatimonadetes bacterium]|nr:hypothetical protein [Armatimonadota bacterium]